jgi:hypothetical protein
MKTIKLTKALEAIVDDSEFEKLSQINWCAVKNRNVFYALNGKGKTKIWMHRFLMEAKHRDIIDHIDGNGLNNQKSNLRICNSSENSANRRVSKNKNSKYLGVFKIRNKYRAASRKNGKLHSAGIFETETEAAIAYNKLALKLHREFAKLNDIK